MNLLKVIIEFVMDILETVVFVGSLFIVVYLYILQPNQVKGASMFPTFESGDYILTSKITFKFRTIERGDVIVFKSLANQDIDYIKRVIGIPGDKVMIKNNEVYVNDHLVQEPYISEKTNVWEHGFSKDGVPVIVPQGELFVMGDNRPKSSDSREFGTVPIDNIIGTVFYRYFPVNKVGKVDNPWPKELRVYIKEIYYLVSHDFRG